MKLVCYFMVNWYEHLSNEDFYGADIEECMDLVEDIKAEEGKI